MPTIRPYTQQVDASASTPSRQAAASDFGNTGLTRLGRAVGSVGQDLAQTMAILNRDEHIAQEKIDQQKKQASHLAKGLAYQSLKVLLPTLKTSTPQGDTSSTASQMRQKI